MAGCHGEHAGEHESEISLTLQAAVQLNTVETVDGNIRISGRALDFRRVTQVMGELSARGLIQSPTFQFIPVAGGTAVDFEISGQAPESTVAAGGE